MTDPARPSSGTDQTQMEAQDQLDPTRAGPAGELVLSTHRVALEPNFGPPEKPGEVGTLGRYRVLKKLGQGGMGAVYLSYDVVLGRRIALKVVPPQYAADAETRDRFLREARAAAMVKSDHVVTIFDVGEARGVPFIAMEYLSGYPLDRYLRVTGELPLAQVLRVTRETAVGLAAAHELGLVHRDVKPGNLWLEAPHGRVKLLDFGLARVENDDTHLTTSGLVVGTPAFMSPEQARGLKLDGRSDLFSLGVTLYRLTTGRMPFSGTTTMAVLTSLAVDTPPPVRHFKADVPEEIEAIIAKLLAKDPAERFQTAWELVKALDAAEHPRPVTGQLPVVVPVVPMAISAQVENVWEGIEASASSPRVLESGTEVAPVSGADAARKRPARKPERKAPVWPAALACAGFLVAVAVLAAVLFWPSKGTLIVEADDADAELVIKQDGRVVRERTKDREIALAPGSYTIELFDPKPGLKLSTDKFEITSKTRTRVQLMADRPKPPVVKPPASDHDRKAAEYVLGLGGSVRVNADARDTTSVADLPRGPLALTRVNLPGNAAATDAGLAVLKNCTSLGFLDLGGTRIGDAGVAHVKDCPNLTVLVLHGTQVTDAGLALLKDRTTLTYLYLSDTRITDAGLAPLTNHKSLMMLDVSSTVVTDGGLKPLIECPSLVELKLAMTRVTRTGVLEFAKSAPQCRMVWDGGMIEPTDPDRRTAEYALSVGGYLQVEVNGQEREVKTAADLPQAPFRVVTLNISRTPKLTDAGLAAVRGCRNIRTLYLNETSLTDAGLVHFTGCRSLTRIEVYFTGVTDAGLAVFKECTNLGYLAVDHTKVTDTGLAHFKDCKNLAFLALAGTQVTDAGLAQFKDRKGLTYLDVHQTQITDVGLAPFKECPNLTRLFVRGTKVTPGTVAEFAKALPNCRIEWDGGVIEPKK
jgi:tRNA A-37 threonylcarbamoyl transferase component Bud32